MHDDSGINVVANLPRDIFRDLGSKKNEIWKVTETSVALFVFCGPCNLSILGIWLVYSERRYICIAQIPNSHRTIRWTRNRWRAFFYNALNWYTFTQNWTGKTLVQLIPWITDTDGFQTHSSLTGVGKIHAQWIDMPFKIPPVSLFSSIMLISLIMLRKS